MLSGEIQNFWGGGGGFGGMLRQEIFIIRFSKMQFPEFSGSELVNRDGIENAHKK